MKRFYILITLLFLLLLSSCEDQVRITWIDDPLIEEANKERCKELDDYFNEKYPEKNPSEMSQDEYYEEWRNLDPAFQHLNIHKNRGPGTLSSDIDLNNQTYTYKEKTYDYQTEVDELILADTDLRLDKAPILK